MSKVTILVGHTGSGKSEIAINMAISESCKGKKVALIDLDIVNPYFCIRDIKEELEKDYSIKVIASKSEYRNAELMVLPPDVYSTLKDTSYHIIMDVGGNVDGARALRQYIEFIHDDYEMTFVVNTLRPATSTAYDIKEYIKSIENTTKLKVKSLICNTNLLKITTSNDLIDGNTYIDKLSQEINIPLKFTAVYKELYNLVKGKLVGELLIIDKYIKSNELM